MGSHQPSTAALIARVHELHRAISRDQLELLATLPELDRHQACLDDGARDMAHWTWMQLGVSSWKAHRWVAAGHVLDELPAIEEAFRRGELGIDKVVELTRFATPEDEESLVEWAREVSAGAIRRKGDLLARAQASEADRDRWLSWRYIDEGRRFSLEGELPAAQGAVVAKAIQRVADDIPAMPGEESQLLVGARRADALVTLCSSDPASDGGNGATVVVHTQLESLLDRDANAEIDDGTVVPGDTLRRLLCNARVQTVLEDADGSVLGLGRLSRSPSAWMMRQLRHRDRECRFPGCGSRRFTHAHHITRWSRGGRTDLDNLVLICTFHHKLVHEYGWRIQRDADGAVRWFRNDGVRYRAGPRAA